MCVSQCWCACLLVHRSSDGTYSVTEDNRYLHLYFFFCLFCPVGQRKFASSLQLLRASHWDMTRKTRVVVIEVNSEYSQCIYFLSVLYLWPIWPIMGVSEERLKIKSNKKMTQVSLECLLYSNQIFYIWRGNFSHLGFLFGFLSKFDSNECSFISLFLGGKMTNFGFD